MITQKFSGEINGQKFDNVEEFKKAFGELINKEEKPKSITADDDYFTKRIITPTDEALENVKLYGETHEEVSKLLEMDFEEDGLPELLEDMDIEELKKLKNRIYSNLDRLDDFDLAVDKLSNLINDVILKQEELTVFVENELDKRIDELQSQAENSNKEDIEWNNLLNELDKRIDNLMHQTDKKTDEEIEPTKSDDEDIKDVLNNTLDALKKLLKAVDE